MAKSVLNKSLKLFEEDFRGLDQEKCSKGTSKNSHKGKVSGIGEKRHANREGKRNNIASICLQKKAASESKISDNLQFLEKLQKKELINRNSSAKILDYQLTKSRKVYKKQEEEKVSSTVFTDEDFEKFEKEYFAKY